MYWRANPKEPKVGDFRIKLKHAWLPVSTDDGWCVWFDFYWVVEELKADCTGIYQYYVEGRLVWTSVKTFFDSANLVVCPEYTSSKTHIL